MLYLNAQMNCSSDEATETTIFKSRPQFVIKLPIFCSNSAHNQPKSTTFLKKQKNGVLFIIRKRYHNSSAVALFRSIKGVKQQNWMER